MGVGRAKGVFLRLLECAQQQPKQPRQQRQQQSRDEVGGDRPTICIPVVDPVVFVVFTLRPTVNALNFFQGKRRFGTPRAQNFRLRRLEPAARATRYRA